MTQGNLWDKVTIVNEKHLENVEEAHALELTLRQVPNFPNQKPNNNWDHVEW